MQRSYENSKEFRKEKISNFKKEKNSKEIRKHTSNSKTYKKLMYMCYKSNLEEDFLYRKVNWIGVLLFFVQVMGWQSISLSVVGDQFSWRSKFYFRYLADTQCLYLCIFVEIFWNIVIDKEECYNM